MLLDSLNLRELAVFLLTAGVLVPLLQRLGVSQVLGFLAAGLAIGPHALGRLAEAYPWVGFIALTDTDAVELLAELGIVFLLFMIGLELSLERLWAMRRLVLGFGGLQILVSAVVIGVIAWGFGSSPANAMVLGTCLALSSTAIVTQILTEQHRFGTATGRSAFSVLLAQDLAVVPILFLVGTIGVDSAGSVLGALLWALGEALAAIVFILAAGRLIIRPLFRFVDRPGAPETFMAVTLLVILITASLTHSVGLSAALGAFLVGLLLGETEFRYDIELNIQPFKGLLLGLFFMSVGMEINPVAIAADPFWIAASVVGLVVLKGAVVMALGAFFRLTRGTSVELALLLGPGGEFAFVVVSLAAAVQLMPQTDAQFVLIVVGATMFITPVLGHIGAWLARRLDGIVDAGGDQQDLAKLEGHVIIAGFGRMGMLLAELLDQQKIPHIALDAYTRPDDGKVYRGDASRPGMLAQLHIKHAAAVVVTMNDPAAVEHVVQAAREQAPHVPVVARARDADHARQLVAMGARHAVPEVFEAGLQLGEIMLRDAGLPPEAARAVVQARRDHGLGEDPN